MASLCFPAAALLGLLAARALASGARLSDVGWTSLYLLAWVIVPGLALWRVLRTRALDPVGELAMGAALGLALLIVGFFTLRQFGLLGAFTAWPLVALPLLLVARERTPVPPESAPATNGSALAALTLCTGIVVMGTPHTAPSRWWHEISNDDMFHAANVAEVLRPPPMQDPRVAGLPFNYHSFSYALPAGLHLVSAAPVGHASNLLLPGFGPALLVLLLHGIGRTLAQNAWAGVAAAGLLSLNSDLDLVLRLLRGSPLWDVRRLSMGAILTVGVTDSLPTCTGLVFTAALILLLHQHLMEGGVRRSLTSLALVGFVASGSKGSVMPVVVAGLLAGWLTARWRGHAPAGLGAALLVVTVAALPMTFWLAVGEHNYAQAMFTLDPLATLIRAGFVRDLWGGEPSAGGRLLLLLPWLVGYLGPAGWFALAWLIRHRGTTETLMGWIAAAGVTAALTVRAPGSSQLFFAYTGLVALIGIGGRALVGERALPARTTVTLLVVGLPFLLAGLGRAWNVMRWEGPNQLGGPSRIAAWGEGLRWLREHAEPDALVASRTGTLVTAALTERRSLFDLARLTPEGHAGSPGTQPFPRHRAALERLYREPGVSTLALVGALAPRAPSVYVLCDNVQATITPALGLRLKVGPRPSCSGLRSAAGFDSVFSNAVMDIYRARLR